eukprot:TRINITY_DN24844_c1_g1_i1.p1 TRINITY_DN24844_c1_g1~~TRINITY_DN24844_c1_g1_i1.p1  ORF type:complete len:427 (+),score=59.13 TRINITY_DN24844_c1_g1_i1:47-1282(+)
MAKDVAVLIIWCLELIYFMVFLSGLVLFVRRADKEPIKSRRPWMVALECIGWAMWCVLRGIFRGTDPPILCVVDVVLPQVFLFIGTTVLYVRTLHLWFQYHVKVDSVKFVNASNAVTMANGSQTPVQTPAMKPLVDDANALRHSLKNNDTLGNIELKCDEPAIILASVQHKLQSNELPVSSIDKVLRSSHGKPGDPLSMTQSSAHGSSYWYLEHRSLFSSPMLACYVVICISFQFATLLVPIFWNQEVFQVTRDSDMCATPQSIGSWIGQGWMIFNALTCLTVSYFIRVVDERLGIRRELRNVTACLTALTILLSINLASSRQIEEAIARYLGVNIYVPLVLICFTGVITRISLYGSWAKTYVFEANKLRSTPSSAAMEEELLIFLNDPVGFELFQNHLLQELAVENILFW